MPATRDERHPAIHQLGTVLDDGTTTLITGWGLSECTTGCHCHRHPHTGRLTIAEDQTAGTLGLHSHRPRGCTCCTPWTARQLAAILRDHGDITALQTATRPAP